MLRLERARPRYSSVFDIRAKITFKHMTAELPEIRLVKLLTITLTEKYTDDATLCWSNIYCLLQKSNSVTTKILLKLFSTIVKKKKQADDFSFVFKLYFSSKFNYVHCSTTNFYPAFRTSFLLPGWWCHAFLQERIQKSGPWVGKKSCANLGGRAQKDVFPITQEKNRVRVQN